MASAKDDVEMGELAENLDQPQVSEEGAIAEEAAEEEEEVLSEEENDLETLQNLVAELTTLFDEDVSTIAAGFLTSINEFKNKLQFNVNEYAPPEALSQLNHLTDRVITVQEKLFRIRHQIQKNQQLLEKLRQEGKNSSSEESNT